MISVFPGSSTPAGLRRVSQAHPLLKSLPRQEAAEDCPASWCTGPARCCPTGGNDGSRRMARTSRCSALTAVMVTSGSWTRGAFLVASVPDAGFDKYPAWSPDGSRIVFVSDRQGLPDWSPDGRFILYHNQSQSQTTQGIWAIPLIGDRKPFPVVQLDALLVPEF